MPLRYNLLPNSILVTLTLFLLIIYFGYIFSRRILKENKLLNLLSLSPCIGSAFYVIILHLIALTTKIELAAYLSLSILIITTIFISIRIKATSPIDHELSKKQFIALFLFSLSLAIVSLTYLLYFNTYDPIYLSIGTFTKQNDYPPLHPYAPNAILSYHYGVILFGAAINILSRLDPWYCLIPIQIFFIFTTPLIIFSLLYTYTKSFSQSLTGSIIGCFCANLTSFKLFSLLNHNTWNSFLPHIHEKLVFMNEGGFAASTNKALISPNMSVAIPISLVLFLFCTKTKEINKVNIIVILLLSIFLFFTYEAFWLPVIIAILVFYLFKTIQSKNKLRIIFETLILLIIFIISPLLIGGVLSGRETNITNLIYFNPKSYTVSWSALLREFYSHDWIIKNEVISKADGCRFYKVPFLSRYFFMEMGLPFIFLPFSLFLLFKKKYWALIAFAFSGLISFSFPFVIDYLPREIEVTRFFTYARLVFSILFGIFLGFIFEIKLPYYIHYALRIVLVSLIITLILPGICWLYPKKWFEGDYRFAQLPVADKKALKWLSNNVKPGDRGLGPFEEPWTAQEIITLGGVYGCSISSHALFESETRNTAFITLDPCLLKELNVKWIYLNEKLLSKIPSNVFTNLKKEKILQRKYKYHYKNEIREIYAFNPFNLEISCKDKNYSWVIGKMVNGKFISLAKLNSKHLMSFNNKDTALRKLKSYQKNLKNCKKAYWYRVEAIEI